MTQVDAQTSSSSACVSKGTEFALPPVWGGAAASDAVPNLPAPRAFGAMELAAKFLALKMKMSAAQAAAGMDDVRHRGELQKQENDKIARNIIDAAEKLRKAKKSSKAKKIFGWIAAALGVVAAVATGGALAIPAAAMALTAVTLTETGVIDKMTQSIAKRLMKNQGMAEDQASWWATFLTVAIVLACSLATLGAGAASGGWNAATSIATKGDKVATIVSGTQRLATVGEVTASVAASAAAIASGVQQKQATDTQAETLDIRTFLARLAELQEDEIERIRELFLGIKTMTQRVVEVIEQQSRSESTIIRRMG
ncbi:type III secretion system translocon subunit SctE [Rhizobium gallicum]|uniref:type III secretion system translocon subunit SctE n=1 Tax=Rhizobium gallicum TaxID=56730 RepID=UPI001EF8D14C|nr:type III secretion system translocon subunit SctE [Rhizobium gallicum]ULJ74437.1 type III secretion system translocon subunit SctE [Rhizobium gallicum]